MMKTNTALACASIMALGTAASAEHRSYTGVNNNLFLPAMGSTGYELQRGISGPHYLDGLGAPMDHGNVRTISNAVSAQSPDTLGNARQLSSWVWQWGQIIDHDFALVDESSEAMNIDIPTGDPVFDPKGVGGVTMPFVRSVHTGGIDTPRQHANSLTHWIDGSMVYGSDETRAAALREFNGGRLKTSAGDMLPYNLDSLPNGGGNGPNLFIAGDVRANEQSGLLAVHTLLVREHNRQADLIAAKNTGWSDEEVYQHARRMVGAQIASITYNEWLPALLGDHGLDPYSGYDAGIDASINTAFSTAAFRIGHTMLNDQLLRVNGDGSTFEGGHLNLFQQFFNPSVITEPGSLDAVIRGLAAQEANEVDTQVIDGVRNLLFGGTNGRDLIALNLQRGRDHGIPDYNSLREDMGLPRVSVFSQITSDTALAEALEQVYGSVDNIDAWIGLFAEDHLPGASMGETATAIFVDQFARLRDGDRFFYLNDPSMSGEELAFVESFRLSDLIRLNSGAVEVQDNAFFVIPAPGTFVLIAGLLPVTIRRRRR